jgi:hypothetical protein
MPQQGPCGFGSADSSADAWSHRNNVRHLQKNLKAIEKAARQKRGARGGNGRRKRARGGRRNKVGGHSAALPHGPSTELPRLAGSAKDSSSTKSKRRSHGDATTLPLLKPKAARRNKRTKNEIPENPLAAESLRVTQYEKHLRKVG